MKYSTFFLLIILTLTVGIEPATAQTDTIFATYTYTMGDNDTKSDARQLCFLYAKRQCLEKAGTFVQSELKVRKTEKMGSSVSSYDELTQQDISTFTGAFVKVDIVSEQWAYSGESMTITVAVKAIVDVVFIYEQILAIQQDKEQQQLVNAQQEQLNQIEADILDLQRHLLVSAPDSSISMRYERKELLETINEIEDIQSEIELKGRLAAGNVVVGMTPTEVIKILGEPRTKAIFKSDERYNYGNVWIIFEYGIVSCLVRAEYFQNNATKEEYKPEALLSPGVTRFVVEEAVSLAETTIKKAELAGAQRSSPKLFNKAKELLVEAKRFIEDGNYLEAKKRAEFSVMRGEQALKNAEKLGAAELPGSDERK